MISLRLLLDEDCTSRWMMEDTLNEAKMKAMENIRDFKNVFECRHENGWQLEHGEPTPDLQRRMRDASLGHEKPMQPATLFLELKASNKQRGSMGNKLLERKMKNKWKFWMFTMARNVISKECRGPGSSVRPQLGDPGMKWPRHYTIMSPDNRKLNLELTCLDDMKKADDSMIERDVLEGVGRETRLW